MITGTRWFRKLCAFALAVAILTGIAAPVAAAPTDLLKGHGVFENPHVTTSGGMRFKVGATFDGWQVRSGAVTLGPAFAGIIKPPQGRQTLVLVDTHRTGLQTPGVACRPAETKVGHRYAISFWAGVAANGTAHITARIGTRSATVSAPHGAFPAVFKRFAVTVRAAVSNTAICFTATNITGGGYPAIDAARAIDLGT